MGWCENCGKRFHLSKVLKTETRRDKNNMFIPSMEVCEECYKRLK